MTETTKEIFEKYEIRKSKKQKQAFREYVCDVCEKMGFQTQIEKGSFGARNIVVGDIEKAKVVYTAHYDTCAVLPFPNFITPKNFSIYLLYQLVVTVGILLPMFLIVLLGEMLIYHIVSDETMTFVLSEILYWGALILVCTIVLGGPANKHTANDNTSGVTVLLDIITSLPETAKDEVAFIFFDLEEMGLFGSSGFASKHKKQMKEKPLINFDCVSDGEHIIFALKKKASYLKETLEQAFPSSDVAAVEVLTKGVFYPSDQANFKQGIGVAALKKSQKFGFLYMDRIHTKKDTVYREENIAFLKEGAIRLLDLL